MATKIAIGSDHGGYALKQAIIQALEKDGYKVKDVGTDSKDPCDYPGFGYKAAREVSLKKAQRGIVICKSGIGMSIIANKVPGVRAALCLSTEDAVSAREHNDSNVLVLSANRTSVRKALAMIDAWIETKTLKGRHARRVRQIKSIEKKVFKKKI